MSIIFIYKSVQETLTNPRWKVIINEKMKSLHKSGIYEIIDLLPWKKLARYQWIYIIKYKFDGIIECFKTRLKGYTQIYRINYIKIFTHVVKINIVWVLLSLVINLDQPYNNLIWSIPFCMVDF